MRRSLVAALVLALIVVSAPEASARIRVIGRASARGDYASVIADGNVDNPTALWVRVLALPRQKVDVYWTMVCSRGLGAGSRSGHFHAMAPVKRPMRMPYTSPDNCIVSASGSLSGEGNKVTVILTARVP